MLQLHTTVYALPRLTKPGAVVVLRGLSLPTLGGEYGGPPRFDTPLPVTFDALQQRLTELPRCDTEPDGFFLLTGHQAGAFWRLNGHMHEYNDSMHRVELSGECPSAALDAVLGRLGWPSTPLAFELVQEGVTLRESDFRRWAAVSEAS